MYFCPSILTANHVKVTIMTEAIDHIIDRKDCDIMNMTEIARLLLGLRSAGWTEKEINDFVLYIESGDEQYKPRQRDRAVE